MKKRKGEIIGGVVMIMLGIIVIFLMIEIYINICAVQAIKSDVLFCARQYMLKMETEGYLTAGGVVAIKQELEDLGVVNVDMENTTVSSVAYGGEILLHLKQY